MKKINLDNSLKETLAGLQAYLQLELKYNKLILAKKLGEFSAIFILFMILLLLGGFFIFFGSLALANFISLHVNQEYYAYLIVAAIYLFFILLIILLRKQIILKPVRKILGNILFDETDEDRDLSKVFTSKEHLNNQIFDLKAELKLHKAALGESFEKLSDEFTLGNILSTFTQNVVNSFVTTSNVAKAVFTLISNWKAKRQRKLEKKRMQESLNRESEED